MGEELGKKLIRLEKILSTTQTKKYRAPDSEKRGIQDEIDELHAEIAKVKQQIMKA